MAVRLKIPTKYQFKKKRNHALTKGRKGVSKILHFQSYKFYILYYPFQDKEKDHSWDWKAHSTVVQVY